MIQLLGQMWNWIKSFTDLELRYLLKRMKAKYYVIIRSEGGAGFFSNYFWVMGHVAFAEKMGYIPVVDMENYPTLYSEEEPVDGTNNAWNYYFENIGNVGLDEVYASGRYIMGKDKYLTKYAEKYSMFPYRYPSERMIAYYAPIIKKNLRIKESLVNEYKRVWIEKTSGSNNILGIHIRGTDMKNNLGHPMPASVAEYIRRTGESVAFSTSDRKLHHYRLGMEVLRDQYTLTHCAGIVCGYSNITFLARVMRRGWLEKEWDDYCLINNGLFHNDNRFGNSKNARSLQWRN